MNWKFYVFFILLMDMIILLWGEKWFFFGLFLVIFIFMGFVEEDGKINIIFKGFLSIYGFFLFYLIFV